MAFRDSHNLARRKSSRVGHFTKLGGVKSATAFTLKKLRVVYRFPNRIIVFKETYKKCEKT